MSREGRGWRTPSSCAGWCWHATLGNGARNTGWMACNGMYSIQRTCCVARFCTSLVGSEAHRFLTVSHPLPLPFPPHRSARRDRELAALDSEFEEHYEDICEEEVARQGLRSELGAGADGQPQTDEAPPPVPEDPPAGDDMPPALDLGVERITIVGAPLPER